MTSSTHLIIPFCVIIISCQGLLEDKFRYYEILERVDVQTITKRSVNTHVRNVNLNAFGKNYSLELTQSKDLFSNEFKITVVHGDNSKDVINDFDKSSFYTGHVTGDPNSKATIHIGRDNVITGSFTTGNEEIGIEPLSHHVEDEESDFVPGSMVTYRRSDIKTDPQNPSLCSSIHPGGETTEPQKESTRTNTGGAQSRHKRNAGPGFTACKLIAVADYRFFLHKGQGDIFDTARYIADIINRINLIYRTTNFAQGSGYTIELDQMTIHDGYSTSIYQYNYEQTYAPSELLAAFSRDTSNSFYCLAHLFTSQAMVDSILGLAYIASANPSEPGGICPPLAAGGSSYNTGWTSSLNGAGGTVTFIQNALVTAHEIGHNWGSEHDPSSGDCAPRNFLGGDGKYLMYAYSVTGEDPNNDEFSTCSINSMSGVLANKAGCFSIPAAESLCGNGRIDTDEQCDGGFLGKIGLDPCCGKDCTLNEGALCSANNFPCCTNCQLASPGLLCRGELSETCDLQSFCDGQSFECPNTGFKPDNTPCLDDGSCIGGVCTSFCEVRNRTSCVCDTVDTSCRKCCREPSTDACQVYDSAALVANGRSCIQGYCENGICIKIATDTIERLWELIDKVSINFLIESFRTNIVLCVTGFSLVLYIPICIGMWCYDQKRKRDWIKENTVHVRKDRTLAHDEDKRPVTTDKPTTKPVVPAVLDPSEYLEPANRRPRNQVQPVDNKPDSSAA